MPVGSETVPDGALFLTAAVIPGPDYLDLYVMGHRKHRRSWGVFHQRFIEITGDPYAGAWEALYQRMKAINGTFYNKGGVPFSVQVIGIRAGKAAERFCERWSPLACQVSEADVLPGGLFGKKYRLSDKGIEMAVKFYSQVVKVREAAGVLQGIPGETDRLAAYNLCLADVWLENMVRGTRDILRRDGFCAEIDSRIVLDRLEKMLGTEEASVNKDNFNLQRAVELMEANGFHVREAREIEKEDEHVPHKDPKTYLAQEVFNPAQKPKPEIEAIRLEIVPKE